MVQNGKHQGTAVPFHSNLGSPMKKLRHQDEEDHFCCVFSVRNLGCMMLVICVHVRWWMVNKYVPVLPVTFACLLYFFILQLFSHMS